MNTHDQTNQEAGSIPTEADVKRLAKAGEIIPAINLYRQIHDVGVKQAKEAVEALADLPRSIPKVSTLILSPQTQSLVDILFARQHRAEATRLLIEECGSNLPYCEKANEYGLERIRFGTLKLSQGDLLRLREAVELAKTDWRDLLVAAGFGNDTQAHKHWMLAVTNSVQAP